MAVEFEIITNRLRAFGLEELKAPLTPSDGIATRRRCRGFEGYGLIQELSAFAR
jgi:hypothetical protein